MVTYSDVAHLGAPMPTGVNSSFNASMNATAADAQPLFIATLNPITFIYHLLTHPKIKDYAGLIALGLVAEFTRRLSKYLFPWLETFICVRSTSTTLDPSHDYLLAYWISRKSWREHAKRFDCETSTISANVRAMPWLQYHRKSDSSKQRGGVLDKRAPPKPRLMPQIGETITFWWRKRLIRLSREVDDDAGDFFTRQRIVVKIFGGSLRLFTEFLTEAKIAFQQDDADLLPIKMIETKDGGRWQQVALRAKRPISSVITSGGVAEKIEKDMKEFLDSESWYTRRGIPYRRGYLLYGAAGAGKTSLIHACASALDLEIYCVTLATEGLTDAILLKAMTLIPPGGVVVMEDVDVAVPKGGGDGMKRNDTPTPPPTRSKKGDKQDERHGSGGHITLSGLLNAIDGISGSEGRLLFMTTNKKEMLDEALIRPGRADLSFEFHNADTDQITRMFKAFYPVEEIEKEDEFTVSAPVVTEKKSGTGLTVEETEELAKKYASAVPEDLLSTAAIQGHLMMYKDSPQAAIDNIDSFVQKKQEEIAKIKEEEERKKAEGKGEDETVKEEDKKAETSSSHDGDKNEEQDSTETTREATRLAAAAILSLVQEGLKKIDSQDSAKIEAEEVKIKSPDQAERKEDNLLVEVEN